jgi:hypothetical protein
MKLLERLNGGLACVVEGPPKTGKSWLLGTAAELGQAKLLALKPREVNSAGYLKNGINQTAQVFHNPGWMPDIDSYEESAYLDFVRAIRDLYIDDETQVVLIDPLTDLDRYIDHYLFAPHQIDNPRGYPEGGLAFYGAKKKVYERVIPAITGLTHAQVPKIVIAAIHTQPTREEAPTSGRGGGSKPHADKIARGVVYEGDVLPAMEGSARYLFNAEWDLVLFTHIERKPGKGMGAAPTTEFQVQVRANKQRHAGIALAPMLDEQYLPNDFPTLLEKIEEALE